VAALLCACSKTASTSVRGDAEHPSPVHLYTVEEEVTQRRGQAVGSLHALEENTLSAQSEGQGAPELTDAGETVKEGQARVGLDTRELQFEVERQRGLVRQVSAQLGIGPNDPPPSDPKAVASVQRAEADLYDAERKFGRAQEMFKDRLISQQQLDEA